MKGYQAYKNGKKLIHPYAIAWELSQGGLLLFPSVAGATRGGAIAIFAPLAWDTLLWEEIKP